MNNLCVEKTSYSHYNACVPYVHTSHDTRDGVPGSGVCFAFVSTEATLDGIPSS